MAGAVVRVYAVVVYLAGSAVASRARRRRRPPPTPHSKTWAGTGGSHCSTGKQAIKGLTVKEQAGEETPVNACDGRSCKASREAVPGSAHCRHCGHPSDLLGDVGTDRLRASAVAEPFQVALMRRCHDVVCRQTREVKDNHARQGHAHQAAAGRCTRTFRGTPRTVILLMLARCRKCRLLYVL